MAFSNEHSIAFAHDEAKTVNGTLLPWKSYAASIAHKNINIKCKFLSYKMNISKEFFFCSVHSVFVEKPHNHVFNQEQTIVMQHEEVNCSRFLGR